MIARATISRCAMPPESAMHRRSARSARRNCSSSSVGRAPGRLRRHAEVAAVEVEVLGDGQARSSVFVWGTTPITCLASAGWRTTSTRPDPRLARGRDHPRREHPDRGGLAGAVRSEQAEDLPRRDLEVEREHRFDRPRIGLRQPPGVDDEVARPGIAALAYRSVAGPTVVGRSMHRARCCTLSVASVERTATVVPAVTPRRHRGWAIGSGTQPRPTCGQPGCRL